MLDSKWILTGLMPGPYLIGVAKPLDSPPSQKEKWALTQESFDRLLAWLDSDRERAAIKHEEIRSRLIKGFSKFGCTIPEELADKTINRVAGKLSEIEETYVGEPTRYFYAVAHNIHREYLREPKMTCLPQGDLASSAPPPSAALEEKEPEYTCLEHCMEQLTPRNREIILQYYQGDKSVRIKLRKELALRQGMNLATLRLRAQRIRDSLKRCILTCLQQPAA